MTLAFAFEDVRRLGSMVYSISLRSWCLLEMVGVVCGYAMSVVGSLQGTTGHTVVRFGGTCHSGGDMSFRLPSKSDDGQSVPVKTDSVRELYWIGDEWLMLLGANSEICARSGI
jgi:hypothetical protein